MNKRRLLATTAVAGLILSFIASCAQPMPQATEAITQETTPANAEPEGAPRPISTDYDPEIHGDLENLDPSGQVVVYWHPYTRSREELMLSMIDEFNRSNEWGITVVGETQDGYDDLYQKIIARIPSNQFPSMAVAYQDQAAAYAGRGAVVALDPYVDSEKWGYSRQELDDFFPIALVADILPQFGARYGWPFYKSMEVMYYNEDWLAELGYDGPPRTWEEFADMSCAATKQPFSKATGEGATLGYEYSIDALRFATFVFSRGGNILSEDGTSYVFNGPEGLNALVFLRDLEERGCAEVMTESHGDQIDFSAGRVLFTINSISRLPYYRQAVNAGAGFKWSVNPPPHSTDRDAPRMNIYGASQSIFVSTPEEQLAAWLFIKWMGKPEQQAQWASGTGYLPIRYATADPLSEHFAESPTYEKAFGFIALDYGIESPAAGYDECSAAIEEMISAVMGGEDAQARLDTAVEQCNRYLQEAAPPSRP